MSEALQKRRRQLPEFRDLFSALFKIPDHDVQSRVLNAINGILEDTPVCKCNKKIETVDATTQTEIVSNNLAINIKSEPIEEDNNDMAPIETNKQITFYGDEDRYIAIGKDALKDREIKVRRKRRSGFPRAEKAPSNHKNIRLCPVPVKMYSRNNRLESTPPPQPIQTNAIGFRSINQLINNCELDDVQEPKILTKCAVTENDIVNTMKNELLSSLQLSKSGLYPIHDAIIRNDFNRVRRQLFVFKHLKFNVHTLRTLDGESPLQLAIKNNCPINIIDVLTLNGANLEEIDDNENTLIHLIMYNMDSPVILQKMLKHYKLEFLNLANNDGFTPLHIAVRNENLYMVKTFIENINEKEGIIKDDFGIMDEKKLYDIYIREINYFYDKPPVRLNSNIIKILNKTDTKHGSTALLFAVKQKSKLISLLLMYNLADPKIADYSETDCQCFANDHFENHIIISAILNTSLYVDNCKKSF